jgi:hypothetical protein
MTSPTPNFLVSAPVVDTTAPEGLLTSLRRSSIDYLWINPETRVDGYNEDQTPINMRTVFAVNASGGGGTVRVAEFDTLVDANDYIRNDTDGIFS